MSEQIGKMLTCDRCSKEVFVKIFDAIPKELDGGFTRWIDIHTGVPDGWTECFYGTDASESYFLCPNCYSAFEVRKGMFFGDRSVKKEVFKEEK